MSNNKLEEFLDDENVECPMCMETLDITDRCFKPCKCGYQLCSFCWHHIKENLGGKCPACRQPYNPENYEFLKPNPELVQKLENEKRREERNKKAHPHSEERRQLANMRVVQRNLVYVTNLAMSIAKEDILKSPSYFGQYGKILKVVVNKNTVYQSPQGPSVSCYITYHRADEALLAIVSVDGATLQGRIVRASFGTTKYCQHFLKVYNGPLTGLPPGQTLQSSGLLNSGAVVRVTCPNPECMYLHELGPLQDSFTKEDMAMGKHLASLDPVIQHILQQAKDAPLTVSGSYKTALPPARQDLLQPLYEQMAAERVREERAALTSSNEHVTAPSNSGATSGATKTPAKNVWKTLPPTTPVSIASTISSEKSATKPLSASMTVKPVSKPEPALSTSPKLSSSVSLNPSPSLNSSASLNTSDWPDLLKASAGKDNELPSEEEEVERVVEPSKKKKSKNSAANNSTSNNSAANNSAANNSSSAANSSDLSASQSALPATARWAKKQKQELADNVPASPASKKHVIVVEQTDTASTTSTAKTSETADDSWPSLTASGTAPSKEERRESRGKNKKKNREDESAHHHSVANNSAANNSAGNTTSANNSAPVTPAVPNKSANDKKKSANNSSEKSDANNRTSASDSAVKTTAVPSKPRTVIDLDAVPSESDATKHSATSATTESVDQLQWISAHVSDLVLSDKDTTTVPVSATSAAPVTPVAPPPGTHTPALTSLFPFSANTSVWTPLKSDAPTALSSLEASLTTAQSTPAQTSPRQRSRFQFANQNPAGTAESKNSPNNVPVTSHLFNEEDLRNTFKALLPNVNISFDSNNSFKHEDGANNSTAVNINSLADFPSLKNNPATMPPPHTQPPQSQLMAQLFAAHPMTTPFNNATPFSANNSNKMYPNSNENQLNELNHTLNTLMFPNAQNAQSFAAPAPKPSGGNWPANNTNNTNNGVALDSNNPLQALLGMNDSIWHSKQQSHGPNSAANNSTGGTNSNSNAGLFYQQLQQLQQLQQMQQPQQQPYFNTFQQPLVTQNLFLINQIQQPSQWPQQQPQQTQYRNTAPNNSNAAPSPWGATTPLSYPQQHAINNFPPNGMPHGFNL